MTTHTGRISGGSNGAPHGSNGPACGASGVAGGSLLLIPMCCALFGITNDIAMQVVGIGFIIGVIQDSCETGLNSSSDVVFTATAEYRQLIKEGKEVHLGKDSFAYHELS